MAEVSNVGKDEVALKKGRSDDAVAQEAAEAGKDAVAEGVVGSENEVGYLFMIFWNGGIGEWIKGIGCLLIFRMGGLVSSVRYWLFMTF